MKNSNKKPVLNGYHIKWGIVVIENGSLSTSEANKISRACHTSVDKNSNTIMFASPLYLAEERFQSALNTLAVSGVNGKIYQITDKQYSLIANRWDGTVAECAKPFRHSVVIREGKRTSIVPMTSLQFNNGVEF